MGSYALIRHSGYLSGMLWVNTIPPSLGSLYAFLPVALYVVLIGFRTYLEDRTLREELLGYAEYAERVRYRLIPGIW